MVLIKIDCHDIMQLHEMIQKLELETGRFYLLFTGSKNEQGISWCPDCVRGEPLIMKALETIVDETVTLLVIHVDREPYRNPEYPLRRDPRINLRCVPTLMKWEKGEAVLRLNDVQCQNCHALDEFLSS